MANYYWRAGEIKHLKDGVAPTDYETKHPDAKRICQRPSIATLEKWQNDCGCKALDGCWTEPDGDCPHGFPSWLKALHYI